MIDYWQSLRTTHSIAVTNVFNEHPEGDKTELFFSSLGEPDLPPIRTGQRVLRLRPEYRHHVDKLYTELSTLQPNCVVPLGNFACWALLGQSGITAIRGTTQLSERLNLKCIPTFHPAALRDASLRPTIVADLHKAKRESEFPEIRRIQRWIVCEDPRTQTRVTLEEIEAWFRVPAEHYSIDIETGPVLFSKAEYQSLPPRMKMILTELISMVSFARDPHNSVVIPFMTRDDPELNYWNEEDETRAWKILSRALDSPVPKIFQNGIFDISHFIRNKLRVRNATDDTMILNHALYIEMPKSLGYMSSIHSDEISYKQMRTFGESIKREE